MRKLFCLLICLGILTLGSTAIAGVSINHNTQFIIEVSNVSKVCNVSVIFTQSISSEDAKNIVSSAMKMALPFRKSYDILGTAWLYPNGNNNDERPIKFPSGQFLIIKKGTDEVIPFKF